MDGGGIISVCKSLMVGNEVNECSQQRSCAGQVGKSKGITDGIPWAKKVGIFHCKWGSQSKRGGGVSGLGDRTRNCPRCSKSCFS